MGLRVWGLGLGCLGFRAGGLHLGLPLGRHLPSELRHLPQVVVSHKLFHHLQVAGHSQRVDSTRVLAMGTVKCK